MVFCIVTPRNFCQLKMLGYTVYCDRWTGGGHFAILTYVPGPSGAGTHFQYLAYVVVHRKWFISDFKQGDKLLKIQLCWTRSSLSSDLLIIELWLVKVYLLTREFLVFNMNKATIGIFLGGSFLTPINSAVADFLLWEDCKMCEPALHLARNFLRKVLHYQSNVSYVSIPNFKKKYPFFQN